LMTKRPCVDRNGNGDLTNKGEQVSAEKTETTDYLEFRAVEFIEADGKTKHSNLTVNQYFHPDFGHLVSSVGVMDVLDAFGQTTNGENGCSFAETPKEAPVTDARKIGYVVCHVRYIEST
jgi:hypothetical protein